MYLIIFFTKFLHKNNTINYRRKHNLSQNILMNIPNEDNNFMGFLYSTQCESIPIKNYYFSDEEKLVV